MRTFSAALLAALSAEACVPRAIPHGSTLLVQTDSVPATVLADGRVLGTTPLRVRLHNRSTQRLVVAAAGHDTAVVTVRRSARPLLIGRINPFAFRIGDAAGGWRGAADTLEVRLRANERLDDAVMAEVLTRMADQAQSVGCEPLLVDGWRDAAMRLRRGSTAVPPDSVRRLAAEEVERATARLRDLCSRPSARVARLREIRRVIETGIAPAPEGTPLAPVFFDSNRWMARDDSVRARLEALGRRLAAARLPVTLVVEGYTDPSGTAALNQELGDARANWVIAELRRGGLPADCCVAVSRGPDPASTLGDRSWWPQARRVVFSLDYREDQP